ncbi:hypothetical protein L3Q82_026245 [Scortum barcoo]|uniref:Uncharacterized protein n=1 Tax=Scortum barcoo TaxID=214431 RepID=A0ACB8WJC2_9TELE|nr:hypothetical protein L3Q82_026245 [Scortum barcoo]
MEGRNRVQSASESKTPEEHVLSPKIALLDGINWASSGTTVRNLGVLFDQDMSFDDTHIKHISRSAFYHLRNIAKIRHFLSQSDAEKLVHAFVSSRLDYCNSPFIRLPKQVVKDSTAGPECRCSFKVLT